MRFKSARNVLGFTEHLPIVILSTPAAVAGANFTKLKGDEVRYRPEKTIDIAATLGKERANLVMMGFALETKMPLKMLNQNCSGRGFEFSNQTLYKIRGAGFRYDTNKITLLDTDGIQEFELRVDAVAQDILKAIIKRIN
jgi:phosphopantothenoylcysteine decarboxylase/phosphopantothenate--cysteine ligase